jgi:protein-S-isoprenylcysteine O-methyltransferase Ste14
MSTNLLAPSVGLTASLWLGTLFEERKLVRDFGQAYVAYRRRVPRPHPAPPGEIARRALARAA